MLDESDSLLLGFVRDDAYHNESSEHFAGFWDTEAELNGQFNSSFELPQTTLSDAKEDFQKMLTDWQEHLRSFQASDNEDLEVTMGFGQQPFPCSVLDPIFDADIVETPFNEASTGRSVLKPKEERLRNPSICSKTVFGMKIGGRDAKLPILEDSGDEANGLLFTLCASDTKRDTEFPNPDQLLQFDDEDCIDIETVTEQNPVLEAGDLRSLLEQFEASEAVNTSSGDNQAHDSTSLEVPFQQKYRLTNQSYNSSLSVVISHLQIKESLPQEVVDKIRASSRKKGIPLISAMPSKCLPKGTRMQDAAATLNRNKLLKLVSGSVGDTVQLDHDYCSVIDTSGVHLKQCDNYKTSTRDIYEKLGRSASSGLSLGAVFSESRCVSLVKDKSLDQCKVKSSCWEKNSKKDSGLESGEVSDAGEEVVCSKSKTLHIVTHEPIQRNLMKKKLNLQEYRRRREELDKQKVALQQKRDDVTCESSDLHFTQGNLIPSISSTACALEIREENTTESNEPQDSRKIQIVGDLQATANPQESILCLSKGSKLTQDFQETISCTNEELKSVPNTITGNVQDKILCPGEESKRVLTIFEGAVNSQNMVLVTGETMKQASSTNSIGSQETLLCESVPCKPQMHSVEVQTQDTTELDVIGRSRSRDHRSHKQRVRRSPSRLSSSSGSSCNHQWQRYNSKQHRRRKRSKVHSTQFETSDMSSASSSISRRSTSSSLSRSRSRSRSSKSQQSRASGGNSRRNSKVSNDLLNWNRRSCSPRSISSSSSDWQLTERERQRQVEERRVVYVGRLPEGTTRNDLRKRFEVFGPIIDISVHFREHGDNYGFVTFAYKIDAYDAVEHGNEDPTLPTYDLCFGGRRTFCKVRYSDLDAQNGNKFNKNHCLTKKNQESFDRLLREAQAKLHKRGKL